jgi:hypothetical protein
VLHPAGRLHCVTPGHSTTTAYSLGHVRTHTQIQDDPAASRDDNEADCIDDQKPSDEPVAAAAVGAAAAATAPEKKTAALASLPTVRFSPLWIEKALLLLVHVGILAKVVRCATCDRGRVRETGRFASGSRGSRAGAVLTAPVMWTVFRALAVARWSFREYVRLRGGVFVSMCVCLCVCVSVCLCLCACVRIGAIVTLLYARAHVVAAAACVRERVLCSASARLWLVVSQSVLLRFAAAAAVAVNAGIADASPFQYHPDTPTAHDFAADGKPQHQIVGGGARLPGPLHHSGGA